MTVPVGGRTLVDPRVVLSGVIVFNPHQVLRVVFIVSVRTVSPLGFQISNGGALVSISGRFNKLYVVCGCRLGNGSVRLKGRIYRKFMSRRQGRDDCDTSRYNRDYT